MNLEMAIKDIEIRFVSERWASIAARRKFSKGETIEVCPLVVLSQRDSYFVEATDLVRLSYRLGKKLVIPGGYGSVYLPSEDPNAGYHIIPEERALVITANRDIQQEEFIHVNRGVLPDEPEFDYNEPSPWYSDGLVVRPSPGRGLGVFTTRKFKEGEYVEVCHLYCLTERESYFTEETGIIHFMYSVGNRSQLSGWAIGYPCFYNHSDYTDETPNEPNITPWDKIDSIEWEHLAVKALRDLEPGTELVFDYSDGYKNKEVGFKVV